MSERKDAPAGRGRLAQVIATRGGLAPPEAPFVIEHREALIYLLCQAAELEHGIMCQYLYAAFSLKQSQQEGLTAAEEQAVRRWRKQISHVATQEMLHLALVQNLLSAIGGAPHLARPNFPHPASHYPAGVHLALIPFGDQALRHFMFLERPEGMDLKDADGMAAFGRACPRCRQARSSRAPRTSRPSGTCTGPSRPASRTWRTSSASEGLFVGPPRAQATREHFGWPELIAVTDVASAQRAIDEILEQGEGPRGEWRDAHFGQFVAILDEFEQLREANRAFDPVRPVIGVNVRPVERDVDVPLVSDPLTRQVMDLFNVSYEILLTLLQRFFAHTEETDAQLKVLADASVNLMFEVVKPLGDLVTTLPAGAEYPGRTAAPSFELFYESDWVLPHRESAWILLTERIREAAAFCQPGVPCGPAVAGGLAAVRSALDDIAGALAVHLPARYAPQTPAPAGDPGTLLARAADFYRTVRGATPADDPARSGVAALLGSAYQAVPAHQGDARTAARLVDSVLRPLAGALPPPAEPQQPSEPQGPPGSQEPFGSQSHPEPQEPLQSQETPPSLWELAVTATTLRARLGAERAARPARGGRRAAGPGRPAGAAPASGRSGSPSSASSSVNCRPPS